MTNRIKSAPRNPFPDFRGALHSGGRLSGALSGGMFRAFAENGLDPVHVELGRTVVAIDAVLFLFHVRELGVAIAPHLSGEREQRVYLAFEPLMTISQTIPTVAIAPLLVLWLGYGALPKVVLVVLSTFFPITVSLVSGFRSVDPDVIDLMRTMNASRWQIFWYAKLPAAAEQFFSGLKISATYAIVGAVIAEWLGGNEGLGVYMTRVRKSFSYDRMFAAIIVISALSLALMKVVELVQRLCMPWKRAERKSNER